MNYTVIFDEYLCLKTETDIFMVIFQKFYFIFLMTPKMSPKSCAKPMASFSLWFPLKLTYLLLPHLLAKSKITFHGHLIVFLGGSGEMSLNEKISQKGRNNLYNDSLLLLGCSFLADFWFLIVPPGGS